MEIVFFVARPDAATSVASSDDIPGDVAAEPMAVDGPEGLLELGAACGLASGASVHPLRDATCRSYPVWTLSRALCRRVATLSDDEIDTVAEAWKPRQDADLYERAACLSGLREHLVRMEEDERLFAILEERAF